MAKRSGALQTRDRRKLRVRERRASEDPGSAVHHFVLHRIRGAALVDYCNVISGRRKR